MSQNRGYVQVDQSVAKSYFQPKLKLQYQSISAWDPLSIGYVMLNLPAIITSFRTYLYGQTNFWMAVIYLQQLSIEFLEKEDFLKIAEANSISTNMK